LASNILPAVFVFVFFSSFADGFNKRFDWIGLERTFKAVFDLLKSKTMMEYTSQKQLFIKRKLPKIIINIVSLAIVIAVIYYSPIAIRTLSEKTGYGQKTETIEEKAYASDQREDSIVEKDEAKESDIIMEITESEANIRSGPGKDYDAITTAKKGDTFIATGNEETASNGRIWYEIYIDDEKSKTGWASQKVIDFN